MNQPIWSMINPVDNPFWTSWASKEVEIENKLIICSSSFNTVYSLIFLMNLSLSHIQMLFFQSFFLFINRKKHLNYWGRDLLSVIEIININDKKYQRLIQVGRSESRAIILCCHGLFESLRISSFGGGINAHVTVHFKTLTGKQFYLNLYPCLLI